MKLVSEVLARMSKVHVESVCDRLRLRWTYQGKRRHLSMGLADTDLGRTIAAQRAALIEQDIITGQYDRTLTKYQSGASKQKASGLTAVQLFDKFSQYKRREITEATLAKYSAVSRWLRVLLEQHPAEMTDEEADEIRLALAPEIADSTLKAYLQYLKAAWAWGCRRQLVRHNPWAEVLQRVKVSPRQPDTPLSRQEVSAIIEALQKHPRYCHYTDLVLFLFRTGCRLGEAIGLQWKHISNDYSTIWIGESVNRGHRGATKTNRSRQFPISLKTQELLRARHSPKHKPTDLVFPSLTGGPIDTRNLRFAWVAILQQAGVPYRSPYKTRHTFISHAIASGEDPMCVAKMAGHDPRTLFAHYAGAIGHLQAPDLF